MFLDRICGKLWIIYQIKWEMHNFNCLYFISSIDLSLWLSQHKIIFISSLQRVLNRKRSFQFHFPRCTLFTIAWVPALDPDLMYSFAGTVVWLSNVEEEDTTTDLFSAEKIWMICDYWLIQWSFSDILWK